MLATSRCIRRTAGGGASSACRSTIFIGVTWLTTTTVAPRCASSTRPRAGSTRRAAALRLSPPGGAAAEALSQAAISSGRRSARGGDRLGGEPRPLQRGGHDCVDVAARRQALRRRLSLAQPGGGQGDVAAAGEPPFRRQRGL